MANPASGSRNAHTFDGYWRLPEKTRESLWRLLHRRRHGPADLRATSIIRPQEQYDYFAENIYPSEVEALVGASPSKGWR
jgi:hypothetical protein